jgi:hypothetical protein
MRRPAFLPRALLSCLLGLSLGACQAVAGIEDRKLDPKLAPRQDSQQCTDYCAVVMSACKGEDAVYATLGQCLGVCALLDPGDPEEPRGNTVACRAGQADNAVAEPKGYCRSAGPGGNGECGTDCEAYCTVFPQVCTDNYEYTSTAQCLTACNALTDQDRYIIDDKHDHKGDTVECRLVHMASATVDPTTHCPHAPLRPTAPWCIGPEDEPPTCDQYCDIELAACTGDNAQYESPEQCQAVCAALPPGVNPDTTANTMACRRYHSFNAVTNPAMHCLHSGPTGDGGHCGDTRKPSDGSTSICESYCGLVEHACPTEFKSELGDAAGCMAACVELDGAAPESHYRVKGAEERKGLDCRVLYTARALLDSDNCAAALGGGACE